MIDNHSLTDDLLEYLIEKSIDIGRINNMGYNLLMEYVKASQNPSLEVLKFLIDGGSLINDLDKQMYSAIHYTCIKR